MSVITQEEAEKKLFQGEKKSRNLTNKNSEVGV